MLICINTEPNRQNNGTFSFMLNISLSHHNLCISFYKIKKQDPDMRILF